jgi:hypothetical protein
MAGLVAIAPVDNKGIVHPSTWLQNREGLAGAEHGLACLRLQEGLERYRKANSRTDVLMAIPC